MSPVDSRALEADTAMQDELHWSQPDTSKISDGTRFTNPFNEEITCDRRRTLSAAIVGHGCKPGMWGYESAYEAPESVYKGIKSG